MQISKIMTTKLITLSLDNTLADAKALFEQHRIHHIIVLDEHEKLIGLLTDRDLYKHLSPTIGTYKETHQDQQMLKKKIHLVMTRTIITATPELTIKEALIWFDDHHISCLPVISPDNHVLGIISWRDLIKVLAKVQRQG